MTASSNTFVFVQGDRVPEQTYVKYTTMYSFIIFNKVIFFTLGITQIFRCVDIM